jgi:hypothetical protein
MEQQRQSNSPQVMCPQCGLIMGLTVIAATPKGKTSKRFECACGYEYETRAAQHEPAAPLAALLLFRVYFSIRAFPIRSSTSCSLRARISIRCVAVRTRRTLVPVAFAVRFIKRSPFSISSIVSPRSSPISFLAVRLVLFAMSPLLVIPPAPPCAYARTRYSLSR